MGWRTAVRFSEQQNVETDWVGLVEVRWGGERPLVGYVGGGKRPLGFLSSKMLRLTGWGWLMRDGMENGRWLAMLMMENGRLAF